jgi:SecD/SecF fusion protein
MLHFSRLSSFVIGGICLLGLLLAAPNLLNDQLISKLPFKAEKVNLGLDLQGGSHLLLAVDMETVYKEHRQNILENVRNVLRKNNIGYTNLNFDNETIIATIRDGAVEKAVALLRQSDTDTQINSAGDQLVLSLSDALKQKMAQETLDKSVSIVRRRVDEVGTKEPSIQKQGRNQILVQLPGLEDPTKMKSLLGKTAKMTFHLVEDMNGSSTTRKPGTIILPGESGYGKYVVKRRAALSGDALVDAQPGTGERNQWVVNFRFNPTGARIFGELTQKNINRNFAIVLDGKVISAPTINSHIPSGRGYIEGNFTAKSASELAVLMRSGALPAPLKVVEERTVGPDLGADSIRSGALACILAFVLIIICMSVYYGRLGLLANAALMMNLILLIGLLSFLQATLTLPGIAGIVLTLGMAVDANVVIFERIREELGRGQTAFASISAGYQRAITSIIDSNLTTLIAALILFAFGSGPVKGFAVTLALGIMTSLFTAIVLTRFLVYLWFKGERLRNFKVHWINFIPSITGWDFLSKRFITLGFSACLCLGSIGLLCVKGVNFGVDFKGGVLIEVRMNDTVDLSAMRDQLSQLDLGDVALQSFGSDKDVLIRIEKQDGGADAQMAAVNKVKASLGDAAYRRIEFVGPRVGEQLIKDGVMAIGFALLAIMLYVWVRFDWQFGLCAVVALFHDVITTAGIFSLLGYEFNLSTVAAILTILGYSINDTVIIYDRVRENLRSLGTKDIKTILNLSINETLSRTLMTSCTTLLAVMGLYLFGGKVIAGLSFALIWGVIIGTYSSIFLAVPTLLMLNIKQRDEHEDMGFAPQPNQNND